MESSPKPWTPPPRLEKWPFFVGDLLLLSLVVAVLVVAGGELTTWQIAFCVLGVIVGATILVAPFIIEFYLVQRLQQESDSKAVDTILRRINIAVGEIMEIRNGQKEEMRKLEHTLAAYEGLAGILEQRLKALQKEDFPESPVLEAVSALAGEVKANREMLQTLESILKENAADRVPVAEVSKPSGGSAPKKHKPLKSAAVADAPSKKDEAPLSKGSDRSSESDVTEVGAAVTLRANILIGIGNKIHVRGNGGGLSLNEGTPMNFLEIGLFQWVSEPVTEALELRLYLNDEIEAAGGPLQLKPGETLEVTPDFPD